MSEPRTLWRCFPWDPAAPEGAPFSPSYVAPGQTVGRFDLHDRPPVRYFAESPVHAIGEALAAFRGTRFRDAHLKRLGQLLAIVEVTVDGRVLGRVPDCTDPTVLAKLGLRPDQLAHHDRRVTQAVARQLNARGERGLRWWSALTGAWHTTVLFMDRVATRRIVFGAPEVLSATHPMVQAALPILGIREE